MISKQTTQAGFTLVEMLVSLALFTVVATIVVGSLLVLISGNGRLQGEQAVMSTLTFALDSMTREIRTGTKYHCAPGNFSNQEALNDTAQPCYLGDTGISFKEAGDSITGSNTRIAYYFGDDDVLYRRVGNGSAQPIISNASGASSGIVITSAKFFATDVNALGDGTGNGRQPTVTIILTAEVAGVNNGKSYVVETTVTQKQLDL